MPSPRRAGADEFRHARGCPEHPERMERYTATRPDGSDVKVTRCNDCGETAYDYAEGRPVAVGAHDDEMEA